MSAAMAMLFWLATAVVGYAYLGYPLLVRWLASRRATTPIMSTDAQAPRVTVLIAAHNEARRIASRLLDILAQEHPADRLSVIVVSDGSSDGTAWAADIGDPRVRVVELQPNGGKAVALNLAASMAEGEILVFADSRQRFVPGTLRALLMPFADPQVGAVSGELVIEGAGDEGLYWRMEKALRFDEARLGWLHGVSGAVHAMRRELFKPMPPGTVLDDMWLPLNVVLSGRRVWMARDAVALDVASATPGEEFHRKLRTLAGNWQLLARLPVLADPLRNPVFLAWFSHKFLRLVVPWALLAALIASALADGAFYRIALAAQLAGYAVAALAWAMPRPAARIPLLPAAGTFLMLNSAALLSLPASLTRDASRLWRKH
ncbi:glycosyltransferase family 2 protein [Marilutibacter alkalisoli]|uniref:Glycosyltransferase family 2 protein n=1 Tax=Marilutibacter alkalisoli TaxID=2591633 RepID=A0A514BQV5_9GAMM|nr:glycosyltransferase family 2 protein [Lysobacter alkalisoli]QDH69751.1 glycosyltransferase family 2 protein [Lysobacter alkalisoli]